MKVKDVIQLRLANQRLASVKFGTCADVVSHFGAMQSQDYAMAKWAVALRMRQPSDAAVEMSVNSGEIIRTHILRPTWHFVSCKDIRWMMELTAPNVKRATQYVDKQVGLTDEIFKKAWKMIERELAREDNLTKEDLMDRLTKKKMIVGSLTATQILIRAELEMRICSGVKRERKFTYSLFDQRIPPAEKISKKDALVNLASRYFNSRGPATVKDFRWWSGLSLSDAKFGMSGLDSNTIDGLNYFYVNNTAFPKKKISVLLPSYDEYMVGYSESRSISFPADVDKSLLGNGIFKPLVFVDNVVVGTWRKTNKEPFVEVDLLQGQKKSIKINANLEAFKFFLQNESPEG
jgi:hypothetical protein